MQHVLVLGAGVAGLSAAQELIERSFKVTVIEAEETVGGRVRSRMIDGLPTEHGFHFVPSFYRHLPNTLSRIPAANSQATDLNRRSIADQLVPNARIVLAREGDSELPFDLNISSLTDLGALSRSFAGLGLRPTEVAFFMNKFMSLLGEIQRDDDGSLDDVTWWDFIEAETQSKRYQEFFADVAVRFTVAMDPRRASARTIGRIALQFWRASISSFSNGSAPKPVDRVFNGPTSDVWLDPWKEYLVKRGVEFRMSTCVVGLERRNGHLSKVKCETGTESKLSFVHSDAANSNASDPHKFDYCVCALPIQPLAAIFEKSKDVRDADPQFQRIRDLTSSLEWMVGLQFYLNREVAIPRGGLMLRNSPWAITAVSQLPYWSKKNYKWSPPVAKSEILRPGWITQTDASEQPIKTVVSAIVSNWSARGDFQNLTARSCKPDQLGREVWSELKAHFNNRHRLTSDQHITDDDLVAWYPALTYDETKSRWKNEQRLLLNKVGSRESRPDVTTCLKNFFLAGDYVKTNTDLASMEAANESARLAVNALLEEADSPEMRCHVWPLEFGIAELGLASVSRALDTFNVRGIRVLRESFSVLNTFARRGRSR